MSGSEARQRDQRAFGGLPNGLGIVAALLPEHGFWPGLGYFGEVHSSALAGSEPLSFRRCWSNPLRSPAPSALHAQKGSMRAALDRLSGFTGGLTTVWSGHLRPSERIRAAEPSWSEDPPPAD